jgi:hypothetical protein
MTAYAYAEQPFVRPPELDGGTTDAPVAIVGAGPIGLAMAIDLAQRGVASVVLDDNNVVSVGSRAICWAKRTLEIFDRLGVGERMLEKGVTWKVGRSFTGANRFTPSTFCPRKGHKYPAFVNLQQYYVEDYLLDRAREFPDLIDIRFLSKVTGHEDRWRGRPPDRGNARRRLHARGRLHARLRWRQFPDTGAHGARFQRPDLRGTVPHLRYRDGGKPLRRPRHAGAVVLVRSALPSRKIRAPAQAARQHLPHRPATRRGVPTPRPRCRGPRPAAHPRHRGGQAVPDGLALGLPLPLHDAGALRAWPGDLRGRQRACGLALRRARRQWRDTGRRQSRLETGRRAAGRGAAR